MPFVLGQEKPPGSGRKPGSLNQDTIEAMRREAEAIDRIKDLNSGLMPLEYMLRLMRDPLEPQAVRFAAARAAAPFVHPALQAVAHRLVNADGSQVGPVMNIAVLAPPRAEEPRPELALPPPTDAVN